VKKENKEILDVAYMGGKQTCRNKVGLEEMDVRVCSRFKEKLRYVASDGPMLSR
jgi:hypothetical protein